MSFDPTRVRGLIFDIDGTLADTDEQMIARFVRPIAPFRRLLFGLTPEQVARRVVMGIETPGNFIMGIPDLLGIDLHLARISERINRLSSRIPPPRDWLLIPGVTEMLAALSARYPMAIVSARAEPLALSFLEQHGLGGYFQTVVSAYTCPHTKPFPDPVRCAAERLSLPPEQCVMIGDTTVDVRAGRAAGAQTIAVLCGFGEERELRHAGADLILPATPLLLEVLLTQGQEQRMAADNDS